LEGLSFRFVFDRELVRQTTIIGTSFIKSYFLFSLHSRKASRAGMMNPKTLNQTGTLIPAAMTST
jgi:hypothetical protein